jgi:hypothetical protein
MTIAPSSARLRLLRPDRRELGAGGHREAHQRRRRLTELRDDRALVGLSFESIELTGCAATAAAT